MNLKANTFTYPEEYMIYSELGAKRVGVYLPYYFTKMVQNVAEDLGAEIYVDVRWPITYVTLIRDLEKEVEECVENYMNENRKENIRYCKEECGGDQKCFEECVDKMRLDAYNACREDIGGDLWPRFAEKARELKHTAELYGIVIEPDVYTDHEGIKLTLKIAGYYEPVLIELGKALFNKMLDVTYAKRFTEVERFAHEIAGFLLRFYKPEEIEKLVNTVDKSKMHVSYIYDKEPNMFKYAITIEYGQDKIKFIITEEKIRDEWVITNVSAGSVLSPIADLTPE
jgi:hypothetical protein